MTSCGSKFSFERLGSDNTRFLLARALSRLLRVCSSQIWGSSERWEVDLEDRSGRPLQVLSFAQWRWQRKEPGCLVGAQRQEITAADDASAGTSVLKSSSLLAFPARWRRQRKEPRWLVGAHAQTSISAIVIVIVIWWGYTQILQGNSIAIWLWNPEKDANRTGKLIPGS